MPSPSNTFNQVDMRALDVTEGNYLTLRNDSRVLSSLACRVPTYYVVTDNNVDIIMLTGVFPDPRMAGPYWATSSNTFTGGTGNWSGPVGVPGGGYTIYFYYTPPAAEGEVAVAVKHEWERIDFKKLTLKQLECAERELEKAKITFDGDAEKLQIIERIEKEVKDAKDSLPAQE